MTTREYKYTKMFALSPWQKFKLMQQEKKRAKAKAIADYSNWAEGL